jgi:23S rRNA (guanine745-N1)-methyltransferase
VLPELVGLLRCPLCRQTLAADGRSLRCAVGHTFDVARKGYVNLLPGDARPTTADSPRMVVARESFLGQGHFSGLRSAVANTAVRCLNVAGTDRPGTQAVVDVGAGTGYYLAAILDRLPEAVGLALDLSKHSLRRVARAHERMGAVVYDAWKELPLRDSAATLVLDIFAPRNAPEFRRILDRRGHVIVVTPTAKHLGELVPTLGLLTVDPLKQQRVEKAFSGLFVPAGWEEYDQELRLDREEIAALVSMGPSAHHLPESELHDRLKALTEPFQVTLSVNVSVYRPAP